MYTARRYPGVKIDLVAENKHSIKMSSGDVLARKLNQEIWKN